MPVVVNNVVFFVSLERFSKFLENFIDFLEIKPNQVTLTLIAINLGGFLICCERSLKRLSQRWLSLA